MLARDKGSCSANSIVPVVSGVVRKAAVGYIRVSTTMQAEDGLSLDAQKAAIVNYCASHDLRLVRIFEDVESGGKSDRPGLAQALATHSDVFVVLKFDRLSRSIKHFCQLYEDYFSKNVELVAIREAIRLDSALGRALVSILLVFAQMEREATGERTKESIGHIRRLGFHFGKVPYGFDTKPSDQNPRYRILVENEQEQAILAEVKKLTEAGTGPTAIAEKLNQEGKQPPQGKKWTLSLVYNLKRRNGWHKATAPNMRGHTDQECKERMASLRTKGHTNQQVANILNEEGYLPYKGRKFNEASVRKLLVGSKQRTFMKPKAWCEELIASTEKRPSYAVLAERLNQAGYPTPRGNFHWWPAQVRQLLEGAFDKHYQSAPRACGPTRNMEITSTATA